MINSIRQDWFSNLRGDLLAGNTTKLIRQSSVPLLLLR